MSYKPQKEYRKAMQRILKATAGYEGDIDGDWGPLMKAAMQRYMDAHDGAQPDVNARATKEQVASKSSFKVGVLTNTVGVDSDNNGESQVARKGSPFKISTPT